MANGDLFGSIASGAASGAGTGSMVGSIIPGVGTAAGAAGGALIGGISGALKEKSAKDSQDIPVMDPMERARLSELSQVSKNLSSGTDTLTQRNIAEQKNIGKAAQTALARNTGGDVGGTLDALLKSQKATQGGVNQSIAQTSQRIPYFDSAKGALTSRIGQRKLELDLLDRSQRTAEAAQARTDANVNANTLLATQGGTQTIPEGVAGLVTQMRDRFRSNQNIPSTPTTGSGMVPSTQAGQTVMNAGAGVTGDLIPQSILNLPAGVYSNM